jgi:hypothetical protein
VKLERQIGSGALEGFGGGSSHLSPFLIRLPHPIPLDPILLPRAPPDSARQTQLPHPASRARTGVFPPSSAASLLSSPLFLAWQPTPPPLIGKLIAHTAVYLSSGAALLWPLRAVPRAGPPPPAPYCSCALRYLAGPASLPPARAWLPTGLSRERGSPKSSREREAPEREREAEAPPPGVRETSGNG